MFVTNKVCGKVDDKSVLLSLFFKGLCDDGGGS